MTPPRPVRARTGSRIAQDARFSSVFDRRGIWLGDVTLPAGLTVYEIGSYYVLGSWQDEIEVEHVRLYELVKP